MRKQLAVITGTFNPVTKAHIAMGKMAKDYLGTDTIVVFVPAPSNFLKTWKKMKNTEIIPDDLRYAILKSVCESQNFVCDSCELDGIVSGKTYDTLTYLQEKYSADRVYYVCGSDKLPELVKWYQAEKLVQKYSFLIIPRNFNDVEEMIQSDDFLLQHRKSFLILSADDLFQKYSASKVREALQSGDTDTVKEMMPKQAYDLLERTIYEC